MKFSFKPESWAYDLIKEKRHFLIPIIILVFIICPFLSCNNKSAPPRPNIILIVADTLRADHLGCYGYPKNITPHLDEFAQGSLVFENAYAPIPSTLPSHVSLMTGVYPDVHQMFDELSDFKAGHYKELNPRFPTIAENLKNIEYKNIGIVSSIWLKDRFGFNRKFDYYHRVHDPFMPSLKINKKAFQWLDWLIEEESPMFFMFLHYYDPHSDPYIKGKNNLPYYSPSAYVEQFSKGEPEILQLQDKVDSYATSFLVYSNLNRIKIDAAHLKSIISLYDAGIAFFDSQIGKLFSELKKKNLYDQSLIIFTSDHGEEFREHGEFIHNQTYEENIHVPLIIKFPRGRFAGKKVKTPVQLIDIKPTLLDYLQIPVGSQVQGRSLLSLIDQNPESVNMVVSRQKVAPVPGVKIYSLRDGNLKLIYNLHTRKTELYNLDTDPEEKFNIAELNEVEVERLKAELDKFVENNRDLSNIPSEFTEDIILNQDEIRRLKSLGYLTE